ncbi:MAG: DUF4349 domain-containing protein [Actinomycetota bacterium]
MGRNSIIRWKVAVAVLATLLVATVSVLVGIYVLGGAAPYAMGGGGDDSGWDVPTEESAADRESYDAGMDASGMAPVPVEDQLVRYASLSLQVDDVTGAVEEIRTAARTAGGFIQSSDLFSGSGGWYPVEEGDVAAPTTLTGGHLTVRVVDSELESFLDAIRGFGNVTAESVSSEDVTMQYTDLDARIPILEAERDSLTAMLARATTVEEELMIRDRVVAVTAELRSLLDQRTALADRDTMATVSVSLSVPPSALSPSSVDIPWFSWYELQQAFASGVAGFQRIVYGFLTAVIATAPLWIPLWIVLAVRRRRRAQTADAVPAAAPAAVPASVAAEESAGDETTTQP